MSEKQHEANNPALTPVVVETGGQDDGGPRLPFTVVAIGASAGGVEAYIELFSHLPADTGMAYVVIPHLAADKKSQLWEILGRKTLMPVSEVVPGESPEPDRVYVIPPKAHLRLEDGVFQVDLQTDRVPHTIDNFFRSLAREQRTRAVGVVLSGMDGDGALGLRAIKGEGGIAIVQSPESAQFPDMPNSSISTEHVDVVLPPKRIAAQLAELGNQFRNQTFPAYAEITPGSEEEKFFARVVTLLRGVSGIDFRLYKQATIRRRVARRMVLHRVQSLVDYVGILQLNPVELRELQEDILINVTQFFRDPDVFENLKNSIFPRIFEGREPGQQVRIWIAGCSTGEEVYSIAICLFEYLAGRIVETPIQIFGTDASERNIQQARLGSYPESIVSEVSPERLRRFFTRNDKSFQVAKRVRDVCIFARQNLCHDPPFSRMDLISCRNVLIYFGPELQRQLIPTFHYALRPDAFLLLGTSETIREFTDLFSLLDRKHRVYSKTGTAPLRAFLDVIPRLLSPDIASAAPYEQSEIWSDVELQRVVDRIVLARYGPPGVVVNERLEIIQSRGHTGPFLEMRQGMVTLQLSRMVRENMAPVITAAVRRAIEGSIPVQVSNIEAADGSFRINLDVLPIHSVAQKTKCFLVLFAPSTRVEKSVTEAQDVLPESAEDKGLLITQMRLDLASTKLYLQSLLEERDTTNQELVSANEEIQSSNEELQSTNEELETTKEELQSSNEELHTVNDELQTRNTILTQSSNDLTNLLNSVNLPVLMLTSDLHIRHFTPPTQRVMNLRPADVGRPFGEIRINLNIDDLTPLFQEVLETLAPREMEVQDREGHWFLLRVRPYRTSDNKIDGLVVALVDIDQLRRSQQDLRVARDFARSVIESILLPVVAVDLKFGILYTNEAFCALIGSSAEDLNRRFLPDITMVLWGADLPLRSHLEELRTQVPGSLFQFEQQTAGKNAKVFLIRGCLLQPQGDQFILLTIEDITVRKEAEQRLKSTTTALGHSQKELRALTGSLFDSMEEERRRVARDLHDDVGQRLTAIEMNSAELQGILPADPALAGARLLEIRKQVADLAEDVRRMSHRLHPSIIEDLGLPAALRSLIADFDRSEKQLIATLTIADVPENLPVNFGTVLYRIAQEALRNVSKHAGRTHVKVSLKATETQLQLEIVDAGYGFDMGDSRSGLGLISMEERARLLGGTLLVNSELGRGTSVVVNVPLSPSGS